MRQLNKDADRLHPVYSQPYPSWPRRVTLRPGTNGARPTLRSCRREYREYRRRKGTLLRIEYFIEDFIIFVVIIFIYNRRTKVVVELVFPSCVFQPRPGRRPRGRPGNAAQLHTAPRIQSPISQHLEKGRHSLNIRQGWRNYLGYYFFFFFNDFFEILENV